MLFYSLQLHYCSKKLENSYNKKISVCQEIDDQFENRIYLTNLDQHPAKTTVLTSKEAHLFFSVYNFIN